jgi:hypothetical protein
MDEDMRNALIASLAANLILALAAFLLSPSRVAIHFGAGGEPNGWAPAYLNALIITGLNLLFFATFFFLPRLIAATPSRWISLPNKEYWLKRENRDRMQSMLAGYSCQIGTITLAFMFIVGLLQLDANLSNPVQFRERLFWWPFGLYIAYTIYWTVRMAVAFRKPAKGPNQEAHRRDRFE